MPAQQYRRKPIIVEAVTVADALHAAARAWPDLPPWLAAAYEVGEIVFARDAVHMYRGTMVAERMRGLDWNDGKYGAGTWHSSAVEVLACDFRLVVTGVEPDYWPHPGIERPGRDVERWWSDHFAARAAA